jgi:3-oxoadipate enol-lactonase
MRPATRQKREGRSVAEINGERIAYARVGKGEPVLLIHSLGTSSALWRTTMAALVETFTVIAPDCRGHGNSSNHGGFSVETAAGDALDLMSALGFDRFHCVGISMGGLIGVTACGRSPQRFLSMVLADSYATVGAAGPLRLAATREKLAATPMRQFAEAYVADTLLKTTPAAVHREVADMITAMSAEHYLQTLASILSADITPLLAGIGCPVLVMVGQDDSRTPVPVSQALARAIANAELVVLPDAAHLAVLDNAAAFNTALRNFLNGQ